MLGTFSVILSATLSHVDGVIHLRHLRGNETGEVEGGGRLSNSNSLPPPPHNIKKGQEEGGECSSHLAELMNEIIFVVNGIEVEGAETSRRRLRVLHIEVSHGQRHEISQRLRSFWNPRQGGCRRKLIDGKRGELTEIESLVLRRAHDALHQGHLPPQLLQTSREEVAVEVGHEEELTVCLEALQAFSLFEQGLTFLPRMFIRS